MATLSKEKSYSLDGVDVRCGSDHLSSLVAESDIIISHLGDRSGVDAMAKGAGVPVVKMVHGTIPKQNWRRAFADNPALVVFNSHSLAKESGYTGHRTVQFPVMDPDDYATEPGECVTQINLSSAKGASVTLRAARSLPQVPFLAVRGGYGNQAQVRQPNVEVQPVTPDVRDDVYARTRILLMPSVQETWGRCGVEAMCSGIPVIAAPTPGLRESLGKAGVFAPRNKVGMWVAEIQKLLGSEEAWAERSGLARERVEELRPGLDGSDFVEAIEAL